MSRTNQDGRYLTPAQASRVYDRIGRFQDWQFVYEGKAIREIIRLGSFDTAHSVFEFGCGTGGFAAKLLKGALPPDCRYVGWDVSPKMVRLSTSRLQPWAGRVEIRLADGSPRLSERDGSFDRFVSNYAFDLLAPDYAMLILAEAHRILSNGGKLCLVSLGQGASGFARFATAVWQHIWRVRPELVGGCRPVDLEKLVLPELWSIDHLRTVTAFAISSEVLVASRR